MVRRLAAMATISALGVLLLGAWPAAAAPTGTQITGVYSLPCSGGECGDDDAVSSGAAVTGSVRVGVRSQSTIGLSKLVLEARRGSGSWVCVRYWNAGGATTFSGNADWDTNRWPSRPTGCSSADEHGDLTSNGEYTFRVTATERTTGDTQSDTFSIKVDNAPSVPDWSGNPTVEGEEERAPVVTISWHANPEPDIVEYRFIRTDPAGGECAQSCETAVSADAPEGQGCVLEAAVYTCEDDNFPEKGFDGRYAYRLVAYRASAAGGEACTIPHDGACIASGRTEARYASLDEPVEPSSTPTAGKKKTSNGTTGGTKSTRTTQVRGRQYYREPNYVIPDTFSTTLPFDNNGRVFVPSIAGPQTGGRQELAADGALAGDASRDTRGALLPIAGGLLMVLGAAHMARILKVRG